MKCWVSFLYVSETVFQINFQPKQLFIRAYTSLQVMRSGGKTVHQVFQSGLESLSKPFEGSRRVLHKLKKARETKFKSLQFL